MNLITQMLAWSRVRAILTLKNQPFEQARLDRDAVRRGLLLIASIVLLAGSLTFVVNLFRGDNSLQIARQGVAQARAGIMTGTTDPNLQQQMPAYYDAVESMLNELSGVHPRIGSPIADFFRALGQWVTLPFVAIGGYLGYLLWVLLFARLLGGQGSLPSTLGATSLFVVPHLLDFFAPIPVLGGILGFIATVWGIIIYTKGVEVSQKFTLGKAVVATLLPAVIFFVLIFAGFMLFVFLVLIRSSTAH